MQIFKFDPKTGKKGDFIKHSKVSSWCSSSVDYLMKTDQIEKIDFKMPSSNYKTQWTCHSDAGASGPNGDYSFQTDEWICFCSGQFFCGSEDKDGTWEWVVLPPKDAVQEKSKEN